MAAGCGIALAGGWIGIVPVLLVKGSGQQVLNAMTASAALRLAVTLMLSLAAALSELFDRRALLTWVGVSYVVLLVVETIFVVRMARAPSRQDG